MPNRSKGDGNARHEGALSVPQLLVIPLGSWPQEAFVLDCFGARLGWCRNCSTAPDWGCQLDGDAVVVLY